MRKTIGVLAFLGFLILAIMFMVGGKKAQGDTGFTDYCINHAHSAVVSENCDHCVIDGGTSKRSCYCYWSTPDECWHCNTSPSPCN